MARRDGVVRIGRARGRAVLAALRPYAELIRLPNVFTAPPDVLVGAALVTLATDPIDRIAIAGIAFASMSLYAGGTALNDAFDAPADARVRPARPIPSGRVDRRSAFGLGFAFLVGGVIVAAVAGGPAATAVAGTLALAIVAYDGAFKGTPVGYLTMGTTRGLNVLLGISAAGGTVPLRSVEVLVVPIAIAIYIAAVTAMADRETAGGNRGAIAAVGGTAGAAAIGVVALLLAVRPSIFDSLLSVALLAGFLGWIGRPLRAAYLEPVPATIGPAVGTCVLGLVLLDAAYAAAAGFAWGVAAVAFLVPTRLLARWFDVT